MTPRSCSSSTSSVQARPDAAGRRAMSSRLSMASAIAMSHTLTQGPTMGVERDHVGAEDLVADRLVEQAVAAADTPRAPAGDALRLQQQRLAEPLGGDDDELVVAVRGSGSFDPGGLVQRGLAKSSATWMSSASTVHARIASPRVWFYRVEHRKNKGDSTCGVPLRGVP